MKGNPDCCICKFYTAQGGSLSTTTAIPDGPYCSDHHPSLQLAELRDLLEDLLQKQS